METIFEWDPTKDLRNLRKHDIAFGTAVAVFYDPLAQSELDHVDRGEQRWNTVGIVEGNLLLFVSHTVTVAETDQAAEIIRIISARQANRRERRRYEDENGSS